MSVQPDSQRETPGPARSYRFALELSAALGMVMFALAGVVGAWVGSACLLAGAAATLAHAGVGAKAASTGALTGPERRFARLMLGGTIAAVVVAALGESLRRLLYGGAPDAATLAWIALIGLAVRVLTASRLMRHQPGAEGLRGLWSQAGDAIIGDLATLLAAGVLVLIRSRWPDILAALLIGYLNRRIILQSLTAARTVAIRKA